MTSFDSMFPDKIGFYFALFQDVVYEHDYQINYTFEEGQFKRRNRTTVINQIKVMADMVYKILAAKDVAFGICEPIIDYAALLGVFTRYSRDIYGFRRIRAKLQNIGKTLNQSEREQLEKIILEGADFGFKVPSINPYIERQAAVLLYWFSVLKPFHLNLKNKKKPTPESYILSYFNEYFTYFLISLALHTIEVNLVIHKDKEIFKEFLNQLHFRNLSRSSLEFFLPNMKARL